MHGSGLRIQRRLIANPLICQIAFQIAGIIYSRASWSSHRYYLCITTGAVSSVSWADLKLIVLFRWVINTHTQHTTDFWVLNFESFSSCPFPVVFPTKIFLLPKMKKGELRFCFKKHIFSLLLKEIESTHLFSSHGCMKADDLMLMINYFLGCRWLGRQEC